MADEQYTPCIRCGKTRIFHRKWKEYEDGKGAPIIREETVCPDAECQKIVDQKFQEIRDRRAQAEDRKKNIVLSKKAKTPIVAKK